jgi:hypothetical protein
LAFGNLSIASRSRRYWVGRLRPLPGFTIQWNRGADIYLNLRKILHDGLWCAELHKGVAGEKVRAALFREQSEEADGVPGPDAA